MFDHCGVHEPLSLEQFRQLVDGARDVIVVTEATPLDEPGPRIVYVNEAFTRLTGYSPAEAIGQSPRFLQKPGLTDEETVHDVRRSLDLGEPFDGPILNFAKDGTPYWLDMHIFPLRDADGTVTHFAAIERDVTARTLRELELRSEANTDPLTGLFNRRGLDHRVRSAWENNRASTNAVILIDLDTFKQVNDHHGHAVGDEVLTCLAQVMLGSLRDTDYPIRLGGDEFALVLLDTDWSEASAVAERVRRELTRILATADLPATTASAGVATGLNSPLTDTMHAADTALRDAKAAGRDRVALADQQVSA
jgi:diguanylate cyclase (GGDEF)-like protein/PAS domain S-box-containing protein